KPGPDGGPQQPGAGGGQRRMDEAEAEARRVADAGFAETGAHVQLEGEAAPGEQGGHQEESRLRSGGAGQRQKAVVEFEKAGRKGRRPKAVQGKSRRAGQPGKPEKGKLPNSHGEDDDDAAEFEQPLQGVGDGVAQRASEGRTASFFREAGRPEVRRRRFRG